MKTRFAVAALLALMSFTSADAASVVRQCGGFVGQHCAGKQFCQFKPGSCGFFDMTGICTTRPRFCPHIFRPVCGCDGKTYGNDCQRQAAGVSKRSDGKCG